MRYVDVSQLSWSLTSALLSIAQSAIVGPQ